jgi:hypothetical protein
VRRFQTERASLSPAALTRIENSLGFPKKEAMHSYLDKINSIPATLRDTQKLIETEQFGFVQFLLGFYGIRAIKQRPALPLKSEYKTADFQKYKADVLRWQKTAFDAVDAYNRFPSTKKEKLPYHINMLMHLFGIQIQNLKSEYETMKTTSGAYTKPLDPLFDYAFSLLAADARTEFSKI